MKFYRIDNSGMFVVRKYAYLSVNIVDLSGKTHFVQKHL